MLTVNFYSLGTRFDYVADSILWNELFVKPFTREGTENPIILSSYFEVNDIEITTKKELKKRKLLIPLPRFYEVENNERSNAFVTICEFVTKFGRGYRDLLIHVPNHPSVPQSNDFSPLDIHYKIPTYPSIDKKKDMLSVAFSEKLYADICNYTFGADAEIPDTTSLLFPYNMFCGFILQY